MNAFDYYKIAEEIADQLKSEGFLDWADKIKNDILCGATSGEILMGIRWHLKEIQTEKLDISPSLFSAIQKLYTQLDSILK